ncbi:quinone oxidoreductase family protein [Nocardiopsis suaedae]|uniref:Zinc-binding alcohol dehydrogenase family protein n=1 Tax=Nocardiopsis suaedae TaxID=3018444 RepID=A0ABT4TER9_9ACTN|nr:zinc-binding alcohol dehydrogenase family protein [Nocardiopsis suaedae]MDA2803200.1 zinc-binding alcohol dehydrogenase family protein [Nocardiopsis suaedae]
MSTVHAAVVEAFGEPPRYTTVPAPVADEGREVVDVLAVGIHPATRGFASGKHYTNTTRPPIIAGIDAVVRRRDGRLAMVMAPATGTLAERIAVDPATLIPVPDDADPAVVAATMNPAMSSWTALHARVGFRPGQSLLVIGATGNAGSMAVKIGKAVGAARVVAAGRNRERLEQLLTEGADDIIAITPDEEETAAAFAAAAADVDTVLDYVWGPGTERAMESISRARTDHVRVLDWVQVGGTGGLEITLGGHLFRQNALRISGSGFGSVDLERADLAGLAALIAKGEVAVSPRVVPLSEVTSAWAHEDARGERTVIVP